MRHDSEQNCASFFSKRRLSLFRLNRLNCHKAGTGWCVKDGEAGSGDFAKQNTTPYPLHIRWFLLTENIAKLHCRHMEEKPCAFFYIQIQERNRL